MSLVAKTKRNHPGIHQPGDILSSFHDLREKLSALKGGQKLVDHLDSMSGGLTQLLEEHKGMADDLLNAYEQMGIIYEITKNLSDVQQESEMLDLFISTLRRSFIHREVFYTQQKTSGEWFNPDRNLFISPWFSDLLDRTLDRTSVLVESPPPDAMKGNIAEVMVGPIIAGSKLVCMLVLLRSDDSYEFHSSEMLLVDSLTSFCGDLMQNLQLVREMREMSISMVRSLVNAVDQKDEYTCGHSLRVAYYATLLGKEVNLNEVELQMLQWSALLHDVGKIGIRDDVLKKKGKLTKEEFDHIKEHPVRSHKVVQEVTQLADALDGILYHHEHFDGTGYPSGLKGNQIPRQARIIQIADVFDALTSSRSYRSAYNWRDALNVLSEEAGKTVDPYLQKVFDQLIREKLSGDRQTWQQMVKQATRFTQSLHDPISDQKD